MFFVIFKSYFRGLDKFMGCWVVLVGGVWGRKEVEIFEDGDVLRD